ncbi:MAG: serine hydroxymethyltransferase [Bradymonadales bacterium]|nr:serine hydroxymethyltransferase [Bradymonadales bacterium]
MNTLKEVDPEIHQLIAQEEIRQRDSIRLIPSENYASRAVLEATGSVLTNKYSEGYPGKRYYEGQEFIDQVERLARNRVKALFGVDYVNVQPYSGSPANQAVYLALCQPGDPVMGMALPFGGHLTHGWNVNFSGILYKSVQYGVNRETERIDFDEIRSLAHEVKPRLIFAGTTAYPRVLEFDRFAEVAREVGAYLVADIAHICGLVVGGVHPSPVPHADVITSTTHKTFRGPRGGMVMCREEHKRAISRAVFPGLQGGPHNHTSAAIAVAAHEAAQPAFQQYAQQIVKNARALAHALQEEGFRLVSGGTDNHLILLDLTPLGVPGRPAAQALNRAAIVTNCNSIPFDPRKPFDPSGVRIGTPAITSRGMKEPEMKRIAAWFGTVVKHMDDEDLIQRTRSEIAEFLKDFPAPGLEHV